MTYVVDKGLDVLLAQINAAAPNRSKASDGSIGDAAHASRDSDHNPESPPPPGNPDDEVDARDFTHDPDHGADMGVVTEAIRVSQDRRVSYVIFNRRVTGPGHGWRWDPYSGTDPHTGHAHVSVNDVHNDETQPWEIGIDDMTPSQQYKQHVINYRVDGIVHARVAIVVPAFTATDGSIFPGFTEPCQLGMWMVDQTNADVEMEDLVRQTLQAASDDPDVEVTLTPEQIAAMSAAVAAGVTTQLDVPTADENAQATVSKLAGELSN
jgi:hypothetical protein